MMQKTPDYIKHEAEAIAGRIGLYIPPYRMGNLMKAAQRIVDLLIKADLAMTYKECLIVLDIVRNTIQCITGEGQA
jgi:hypothetical protein